MTDDVKAKGHGWDAAKLLGIVITIGTIVFSAGAANEKLKHIETSRQAEAEQQAQRVRLHDDRYDKLNSAVDRLDAKVEKLTEEVKRARWQRRGRDAPRIDPNP